MNNFNERLQNVFINTLNISSVPAELSQSNCREWDSICHLNLIVALEAEFEIMFTPEEIVEMTDLASVDRVVRKKLNAS